METTISLSRIVYRVEVSGLPEEEEFRRAVIDALEAMRSVAEVDSDIWYDDGTLWVSVYDSLGVDRLVDGALHIAEMMRDEDELRLADDDPGEYMKVLDRRVREWSNDSKSWM